MRWDLWWSFFAFSWAISISPGPGAVMAMSSGLNHGFVRGYFATLGLVAGILFNVFWVALGVGALLKASPLAFEGVRYFGAGYLAYLGIQQWRSSSAVVSATEVAQTSQWDLVRRGFFTNVTNPKGLVFLLAVMPQFIDPARPQFLQYATMGATLAFTDLVIMAGYTLLAAQLLRWLSTPERIRLLNRIFGTLFVLAAIALVVSR